MSLERKVGRFVVVTSKWGFLRVRISWFRDEEGEEKGERGMV